MRAQTVWHTQMYYTTMMMMMMALYFFSVRFGKRESPRNSNSVEENLSPGCLIQCYIIPSYECVRLRVRVCVY